MKRLVLIALTAFLTFSASAQLRKLTLEESVLQQYRGFRPDMLLGFQWIPNTNKYTWYEDMGRKLMVASGDNKAGSELTSAAAVSKSLGAEVRNFGTLQWKDANTFIVQAGPAYYEFNTTTSKGRKLFELPESAGNIETDDTFTNVAFTEGNNLYYIGKEGKNIAVTINADVNIVSGQTYARSEFGIKDGIFWSPKSSMLAFYQKDETEVADYPLLDINTVPGTLQNIKYPMIGQKSEKPRVGIYNLATQQTVFISPRGASDDYLTNLSWSPDEKYVLIAEVNRGQNDMSLNVYDAATGAYVRTIINEKNGRWVEPEFPAFFPSKTSNNFIWVSEQDGFTNMYYYSIEGKLLRKLTNNKFMLTGIAGANAAGNVIFFNATGPNPTNSMLYKVDLKGKQTLVTKDEGTHDAVISTDGNFVFDAYSNHTTQLRSVLYDKNGKATELLSSKDKYEGYAMGTSEIKTIKAADGVTDLYTRLIKPSNFDPAKKYPVLVYVYGGPHAQMITNSYLDGASLWKYWMAEQGYLVFTVDNRGSANRGFAFESIIHGRLGTIEMEDQLKGVDYLKSLPYVDADRLAVHGWSFGGFMTTSLMLRHPDVFKVGVAGGPVTDWKLYEVMYGERYMDTPAENAKGFDESSTLNYVKNLKGKLMLIHGTSDDVVVMQHNLMLVQKFVEAGKQVDFFPYPMHKHNVGGRDRVHLMQKVLDYVIEKNRAQ